MKKDIIAQKVRKHYKHQKYFRVSRLVAENVIEVSKGYIVDYSKGFVIIRETEDFRMLGYNILPVHQFTDVRYNSNDKYYDKIMLWKMRKRKLN